MELDEYIKQNPTNPKRYKYSCMMCKRGFDKPKKKSLGSLLLELGIFILALIGGTLFLGVFGVILAFVVMIIVSLIRIISTKKVCPHCNSEVFLKNF